jgi:alpha-L-rhamnosidase
VLPLLFGLTPSSGVNSVVQFLKEKRLSCGVYFSYFYLKALAHAGERAFVYSLLVTEEPHELLGPSGPVTVRGYWTNMLREGASACFESWSKELKWNTSLCHPWASSPIPILIEDILGLKPAEPGWAKITCEPLQGDNLPDWDVYFTTAAGVVHAQIKGRVGTKRLWKE